MGSGWRWLGPGCYQWGGDKWLDSPCVLQVALIRLADGKNVRYERREESKRTAMN